MAIMATRRNANYLTNPITFNIKTLNLQLSIDINLQMLYLCITFIARLINNGMAASCRLNLPKTFITNLLTPNLSSQITLPQNLFLPP